MRRKLSVLTILMSPGLLCIGQAPVIAPTAGFVSTSPATPDLGAQSASVMIASRAKALGDKPSASGTLYQSVSRFQAAGLSSADLAKALAPIVVSNSNVHNVDVQIDLGSRPITVPSATPVNVGTVVVLSPAMRNNPKITINEVIAGVNLTVVP